MAIRYVTASGGLASGSASTAATAWTTAYMNSNVAVGDTVYFLTGTYTGTNIEPVARPTSEAERITFMSAPGHYATFDGRRATLTDRDYITLYNMRFITRGGACIWAGLTNQSAATANSASHLIFDTLTFDDWGTFVWDSSTGTSNYNFAQLFLRGRNHIIRNCTFLKWKGTDCIQLWGEGHLIEDNDFGWNDAGHGSLIVYGGRNVVRRNYFRNKWARAGEQVGMSETDQLYYDAPDSLWEDNVFYDCGFAGNADGSNNEGHDAEGWAVENGQSIGDLQLTKLGGSGTIYRNTLWVGANETPETADDYRSLIQIIAYDRSGGTTQKHRAMEHMRIYHNTFYDNKMNGVYFNPPPASQGIPTADVKATDNRWLNNIIHSQDLNDFDFASGVQDWLDTWHFHGNIFTGTTRDRFRSTIYSTFNLWASAWNQAGQATSNVTTAPTFRDPKYRPADSSENNSYPESNRNLKLTRDNFRLHTNSPVGRGTAVALATVTQTYASATTTLAVSDVYPFYPDDNAANHSGEVPGDEIIVNGQTTRVMSRNKTTSVLTVSPAVTAPDNSEIWLAKYGANPDRGILPLVADDPASETMLLDPVQRGQTFTSVGVARNTFTATGIFPSSYALLVVSVCYRYYTPTGNAPNFNATATTTIGDFTLTRVVQQLRHATTTSGVAIYVGQVGPSAVEGTITVGMEGDATPTMWAMQVTEIRGHHIVDAIRQSAGAGTSQSTLAMTLLQTPLADSIVSGAVYSREDTDGVTEGSGFEEIDDFADGNVALQTQWRRNPTTTVDWSGLNTTGGNVAVAIEIVAADANTNYLFADDLTSGAPVLGTPTLSTIVNLQPASLTAGTPELGEPTLTQAHALTAQGLVAGTPQLGTPAISQTHALTANNLVSGAPVLESPAVATVATGELVPLNLVAGAPQLGTPTLTQIHKLYPAPVIEA